MQSWGRSKCKCKEGGSPLHLAAADGYTNVIIELIKQGANVEMTDSRGLTPIILAAASGDGECVATLLKDGKVGGAILTGGFINLCKSGDGRRG